MHKTIFVRGKTFKTRCFRCIPILCVFWRLTQAPGSPLQIACMEQRNKPTRTWSLKDVFNDLAVICDQKHSHAQVESNSTGFIFEFPDGRGRSLSESCMEASRCTHFGLRRWICARRSLKLDGSASIITSHFLLMSIGHVAERQKTAAAGERISKYKFFWTNPSQEPEKRLFFRQQPNGARVVQRQSQWGMMRVDEQSKLLVARWKYGQRFLFSSGKDFRWASGGKMKNTGKDFHWRVLKNAVLDPHSSRIKGYRVILLGYGLFDFTSSTIRWSRTGLMDASAPSSGRDMPRMSVPDEGAAIWDWCTWQDLIKNAVWDPHSSRVSYLGT